MYRVSIRKFEVIAGRQKAIWEKPQLQKYYRNVLPDEMILNIFV